MQLATWRMLARIVRRADLVLEVLDAREPLRTRSRRLERMAEALGKNLMLIINKSDLIPREVAEKWKRIFEDEGFPTLYMAARSHLGTGMLRSAIRKHMEEPPIIVAVTGYPKVGKSTIINALKGRHSASTSPIPGSHGYTRHPQLYRVDEDIYMIDSPGTIPIEGGLLERIIRGTSPETLEDPVPAAAMLIRHVLRFNPAAFRQAYSISSLDPYRIMEQLALRRGWRYKKTGEPLIEEAARTIIRDYHKAKIPFYEPPAPSLTR